MLRSTCPWLLRTLSHPLLLAVSLRHAAEGLDGGSIRLLLPQEVTIDLIVVDDGYAALVVGDVEIQRGVVDGLGQVSFLGGVECLSGGLMAILWLVLPRVLIA
jgi:hypothetical protein